MGKRFSIIAMTTILSTISAGTGTAVVALASAEGKGQIVAVIDNRFDPSHPEIKDSVLTEVCIGDVVENINKCSGNLSLVEGPGASMGERGTSLSENSHGTSVASVIVGKSAGYAKGAKVILIKNIGSLPKALDWVDANSTRLGISTVVMSMAYTHFVKDQELAPSMQSLNTSMEKSVASLKSRGIASFFPSGNDGSRTTIGSPALLDSSFSVGASNENGIATYSNASSGLTILADGRLEVADTNKTQQLKRYASGTSLATPLAASFYTVARARHPELSPDQIVTAMRVSATMVWLSTKEKLPKMNPKAFYALLSSGVLLPSYESVRSLEGLKKYLFEQEVLRTVDKALVTETGPQIKGTSKIAKALQGAKIKALSLKNSGSGLVVCLNKSETLFIVRSSCSGAYIRIFA